MSPAENSRSNCCFVEGGALVSQLLEFDLRHFILEKS
jgi:hypothetical protein